METTSDFQTSDFQTFFIELEKVIKSHYTSYIDRCFERMNTFLATNPKNPYNDRFFINLKNALYGMYASIEVTTKGTIGRNTLVRFEKKDPNCEQEIQKYAHDQMLGFKTKFDQKCGTKLVPIEFAIRGDMTGRVVFQNGYRMEMSIELAISKNGVFFYRFPWRFYLDGKFIPAGEL